MIKATFAALCVCICCFNPTLNAQDLRNKSVLISTGSSQAPYYIIRSRAGLITEIIEASCYQVKLDCRLVTYSNQEALNAFMEKKVDATANALPEIFPKAFLSDQVYTYKNRVFSLTHNQFYIHQVNDLQAYSIVAFNAANKLLGEEFNALSLRHNNYQENQNQTEQIQALFKGEADTIIADELIFAYLRSRLINKQGLHSVYRQSVTMHKIFADSDYRLAFHDKKIRDKFNQGLEIIKDNGRFEAIINKYQILLHRYLK